MSLVSWETEMALIETLLNHDSEKTTEGIIIIDCNGKILNINNNGCEYLEIDADQAKRRNIRKYLGNDSSLLNRIANGESIVEERILAAHNKHAYFISVQPVLNNMNKITHAVIWLNQGKKTIRSEDTKPDAITNYEFNEIIGESCGIQEAIKKTKMFADTYENILLTGESGTGKELFAQAIHHHRCPNGPFIAINCAALPRELIQSELFGYEGGSFTGAERGGRSGKIEMAEGGTLFLDEIGDMSLDLQATLLRVLEDKQVMRIGGNRYKKINCTIVAATNKDLLQMVEEKRFREDLFYRLSVFPVYIPPLRDREMDAQILSQYFVDRYCANKGMIPLQISRSCEQKIQEYHWPGNVRQLHNALIFAINTTNGNTIHPENLPEYITSPRYDFFGPTEKKGLKNINLKDIEKVFIENAMKQTGYKVSLAAEILGTNRSTLYRKLQEYGIKPGSLQKGLC